MGRIEIAQKIREARRTAGFTQAEAAAQLGLNPQTVSDYERGRTRIPSDVLQRLCALYGLTPGEFLGETPEEGDELYELREALRQSPGMKTLFSVARNATEEDLRKAVAIIEALRRDSQNNAD